MTSSKGQKLDKPMENNVGAECVYLEWVNVCAFSQFIIREGRVTYRQILHELFGSSDRTYACFELCSPQQHNTNTT